MTQFAIIAHAGKQYKVEVGQTITLDRMEVERGSSMVFPAVLLVADTEGQEVKLGTPTLENAKVTGTIMAQSRGKKLISVKYKPKVHYHRTLGFRASLTKVKIDTISGQ